ncbi:hypothetical protein [Pseudothauera rhizosphaerae]|uniref:Uncharacterized protein n=1 Tax=Pseudothauera rhizosphaerae TaxID=2565932 RepID=A0A4S4APQ4_9RHOO|nr:hypothetical protein [Pseudothauera rhizosphaerae]THF61658.1 hypothetical protein E6O51_09410 [Pseudothauera rhizosphaerae]
MENETSVLPGHVVLLGQALRPLRAALARHLETSVAQTGFDADFAATARHSLDAIDLDVRRICAAALEPMGRLAALDRCGDAEILGAAQDFQAVLLPLMNGHTRIAALRVPGEDAHAHGLLLDTYRHHLRNVLCWLEELTDSIADPVGALRRRGLPTTGRVELRVRLTSTLAPQRIELGVWIAQRELLTAQRHRNTLPSARPAVRTDYGSGGFAPLPACPKAGLGFWGTLGAVVLGVGIAGMLFGDDCDCE